MLRLIGFLILLAPVTYGGIWLANHPGRVVLEWQGYELQSSVGVLLILLAILFVAAALLLLLVRAVFNAPTALHHHRTLRRYDRGLQAITATLSALALGDQRHASRQLRRAKRYLGQTHAATQLLGVQIAHAAHNHKAVSDQLEQMMQAGDTRAFALRGKIMSALRDDRTDEALTLAREAWNDRQHDRWLALVILNLTARANEWGQMLDLIATSRHRGGISRSEAGYYTAVTYLERARIAHAEGAHAKALESARIAARKQPHFIPALLLVSRLLRELGRSSELVRFIARHTREHPHPQFAEDVIAHFHRDPSAKQHKRIKRLFHSSSTLHAYWLAEARLSMALAEWERAENALKQVLTLHESTQIYQWLAEVETQRSGDEKIVSQWLEHAVRAPKNTAWLCSECGTAHDEWRLHCNHCHAFDQIHWQLPEKFHAQTEPILIQDAI